MIGDRRPREAGPCEVIDPQLPFALHDVGRGALSYRSEDTGSASRLEIRSTLATVSVYDPGTFGGMQAPISCRPGRTDAHGNPIEANNVQQLRVFVEGDEAAVDITGPFRRYVDGGYGADRIRTGETQAEVIGGDGNDDILTGPGDDTVNAGPGSDVVETAGGADRVDSADGEPDQIRCGDGADTVTADTVDAVDASCETVQRQFVPPPATSAEGDVEPPRLSASAARTQRIARRRVVVTASSTEAGSISASAYLAAGGVNLRIKSLTRRVVAGQKVRLALRLSGAYVRRVRRDLARGRRPKVVVRVAAADRAGNATKSRTLRITLRS